MNANATPARRWIQLVLCVGAALTIVFVCLSAAFFYGPTYNLSFLFFLALSLLGLIAAAGPTAARVVWHRQPLATGAALAALLCLAVQQSFASISPETGLSGAWLLAIGPLSFLAFSVLGERAGSLGLSSKAPLAMPWLLVWVAVAFAVFRLVTAGQRPFDPLADASALACLLYLAWVPWMHEQLHGREGLTARFGLALLGSFLLLLTLFATGSRAGSSLIVIALLAWSLLALLGRGSWPRLGALFGCVLVAAVLAYQLSSSLQTSLAERVVADESTGERLQLARAALALYGDGSLHGSGPLTFGLRYGALRSTADQTSGGTFVHNDYLQLLTEGGPWLLWPLLVLAFCAGWQLLLGTFRPHASLRCGRFGGWLAIALCCVHAAVNFIVYTPALALMIGAVLAYTLMPGQPDGRAGRASSRAFLGRTVWGVGLGAALLAALPLLIDSMSLAVFSGQADLFGSARYRSSPQSQQAYARASLALLPQRSLPRLTLALSAAQRGRQAARQGAAPAMVAAFNEALRAYRAAYAVDPWNTDATIRYAGFIALRQSDAIAALLPAAPLPSGLIPLRSGEHPQGLLQDALARNPRSLAALGALVGLYDQQDRADAAYAQLKESFGNWMAYHLTRQPQHAQRWLVEFERRAVAAGDEIWASKAAAALDQRPPRATPPVPRHWFLRWQQARRGQG